jgi:hypothetical protein
VIADRPIMPRSPQQRETWPRGGRREGDRGAGGRLIPAALAAMARVRRSSLLGEKSSASFFFTLPPDFCPSAFR